jgi:hypothetical protein
VGGRESSDAHEHEARYEQARQVAVSGGGEGWRHGLGLLATEGVAAWMGAWAAWAPGGARNQAGATPSQAEPSSSTPTQKGGETETGSACTSLPTPAAKDVVAVLAQMTLAHARIPEQTRSSEYHPQQAPIPVQKGQPP